MKKSSKNVRTNKDKMMTSPQGGEPLFCVTKPPRVTAGGDVVIENDWGRATFKKCKLTTAHWNLIAFMFAHHHGLSIYEDGCVRLQFDLAEIQKLVLGEEITHTWLLEKFEDLRESKVITETKRWVIFSGIICKYAYSKNEEKTNSLSVGNRLYWVVFGAEFMRFFRLDPICLIRGGVTIFDDTPSKDRKKVYEKELDHCPLQEPSDYYSNPRPRADFLADE